MIPTNHNPRWSPELYNKAWLFATLAHRGQFYGGAQQGQKLEYINHIGSVAMEAAAALSVSQDCDADLCLQCALLHDVLEDTSHSYEDLSLAFGQAVADGVQALSKNSNLPDKKSQMADSLARIRLQPKEIWMVKLADRICNLQQPPYYWDAGKILAYRDEAQLIYDSLHEANPILAQRLQTKINHYPSFIKKLDNQ